jgi:hypothetical protein
VKIIERGQVTVVLIDFVVWYVLLNQGVFVAVLPAHPCQNVRVAMWVRTGSLRPLAPTQQPAQVMLSEQSDKSDITESTIRLIRVCQSVPELAPRLQLLK